jgi:hypothetical protein
MLGERVCRTPEEFKAWSQNLGHEQVLTTFSSYGEVSPHRQAQIIRSLATDPPAETAELREMLQKLSEMVGRGTLKGTDAVAV